MEKRIVFETMGTVGSLICYNASEHSISSGRIQEILRDYDNQYSLFKPESELSKIASQEINLIDASDSVKGMYTLALSWRDATHGVFTPHRPDGVVDLSGVVKAVAIQTIGESLTHVEITNWCLNIGGDILVSGNHDDGSPWVSGIVDPEDRTQLITSVVLDGDRRACATSGSSERGDHIWSFGGYPTTFVQATVIANDIITADVLATAIVAGDSGNLDQICESWDVDVMVMDHFGNVRMTPRFLS